jgi:hypothetical protein
VSPSEAIDLSLYDAIIILEAAERRGREDWHRARFISMYAMLPHVKKGSIKSDRDLMEFEWERVDRVQQNQAVALSEDDRLRILRKWADTPL